MNKQRISWPEYGLKIARIAALRSEDPYIKVGCCVLRHDNSVLSVGYNGCLPGHEIDWSDRDKRRMFVSHAEVSALRYARPNEAKLIAVTLRPCSPCIVQIGMYGIKDVYYDEDYCKDEKTLEIAKQYKINLYKFIPFKTANKIGEPEGFFKKIT